VGKASDLFRIYMKGGSGINNLDMSRVPEIGDDELLAMPAFRAGDDKIQRRVKTPVSAQVPMHLHSEPGGVRKPCMGLRILVLVGAQARLMTPRALLVILGHFAILHDCCTDAPLPNDPQSPLA
jgi:hypothetical protein